jgi:hypothetical protein
MVSSSLPSVPSANAALPSAPVWPKNKLKKRAFVQTSPSASDVIDVSSQNAVYSLTRDMVRCFFDIPSIDAAKVLRVCLTVLKKMRKWVGVSRWPFTLINMGIYEMSREEIVELRRSIIARLEGGEETKYPGVLPLLREAEMLGLAFKAISMPTMYALEDRAKALALKETLGACRVRHGKKKTQLKAGGTKTAAVALPARVVTGVFKKPVVRRKWGDTTATCLTEPDGPGTVASAVGGSVIDTLPAAETLGTAESLKTPETAESTEAAESFEAEEILSDEPGEERPALCPFSYAKDCSTPAWIEPAYPPASEIVDGIEAFWPVWEDPRRLWLQELVCRSLVPSRCGPGIAVADLVASAPVSAAEMRFVGGFFKE